jgi:putative ABC transport system ATP-binding protein
MNTQMTESRAQTVGVTRWTNQHPELFASVGERIKLERLTKRYATGAGEVQALAGVDLVVEPGRAVAIMGRSGCGKTTLLNMLGGIDHPTSGTIRYGERDLSKLSDRELERYRLDQVGFVFQLFNLIPSLPVLGNVMLPMVLAGKPLAERRARASKLLEIMGLKEKLDKWPDQLSGGEQQRVALCVALANDPPLILADEPTGNLDSRNADAVAEMLCSLARDNKKTVLIVSHDPHIAPKADRVLYMEDGGFVDSLT